MKILYVIPELHLGGAERQSLILAKLMQGRGHDVRVLVLRPSRRPMDIPGGLDVVTLACGSSYGPGVLITLIRQVGRFKPDVMHTIMFGFDLLANIAARLRGVPVIISSRRQLATWRTARHLAIQNIANLFVDAVTTNSLAAADYCCATERGLERGRVYTVPNVWQPAGDEAPGAPLPEKKGPCLLNVANFWRGKGQRDLIQAFARLASAHPDISLWLVGEGDQAPAAQGEAERLGVRDRVHFLGRRDDVDHIMQAADLYVHASEMESSPGVILEAMANGTPVIAFACGGTPELLDGGDLGQLVQPGNINALAHTIDRTLRDSSEAGAAAARAREVVDRRHSPDHVATRCSDLYDILLASRGISGSRPATVHRIAMYTVGDRKVPGTRFRTLQFIPSLQEHGFLVRHFGLPRPRPGRLTGACDLLLHAPRRVWQLRQHARYDTLLIQKGLTICRWRWPMRKLRAVNRSFVMDVDDAVIGPVPVEFPGPLRSRQDDREPETLLQMSSHMIAGNDWLRETARPHVSSISVIPTVVDCRRYGMTRAHPSSDGRDELCILWSGQSSTLPYLLDSIHAVCEAAKALHPRAVVLRIICDAFTGVDATAYAPLRVECIRWSLTREIDDLLGAHVGIMPLPDNLWTRGKCNLKLLQYMALGIPPIASPVGVNTTIVTDGENGLLAATADEWVAALIRLLSDDGLRTLLSRKARETARGRYSVQQYTGDFIQAVSGASS